MVTESRLDTLICEAGNAKDLVKGDMNIKDLRRNIEEMHILLKDPQTGHALWWKMLAKPWEEVSKMWSKEEVEKKYDEAI